MPCLKIYVTVETNKNTTKSITVLCFASLFDVNSVSKCKCGFEWQHSEEVVLLRNSPQFVKHRIDSCRRCTQTSEL